MEENENYYDTHFEDKMKDLFEKTKHSLSKKDKQEVYDLIVHGECGVAYELLCDQLYEYSTPISQETYDIIVEIGRFMKCKESDLILMKNLVKEE